MAERKPRPVWVRSFHPADTDKNLDLLADAIEVLLPDYPVLTKDLDDSVEVTAGASYTFDLTVEAVERRIVLYGLTARFYDIRRDID